MKTIITVQHTESIHHTNGMVGSWTDWDLSNKGHKQAQLLSANLFKTLEGYRVQLYTSDLKRAYQTAQAIEKTFQVQATKRFELRERNLGSACGQSKEWLNQNKLQDESTVDDKMFLDAESKRDAWKRLKPFYDALTTLEASTIIIVSHGDLLSLFMAMWLDWPIESLNHTQLFGQAGGVSILRESDDGKKTVVRFSDMSFIK